MVHIAPVSHSGGDLYLYAGEQNPGVSGTRTTRSGKASQRGVEYEFFNHQPVREGKE